MVSSRMAARIRQQWRTTQGNSTKMAKFLGLNQNRVRNDPPANVEDLLEKFDSGHYGDYSSGTPEADAALQIGVAQGLAGAVSDIFENKYGVNISAQRLSDVVNTKCTDVKALGPSLVRVVGSWNSTNKDGSGTSIADDDGETVYHTKLRAFVTDDFSVAVEAVQRLNNDDIYRVHDFSVGSSCVGMVRTPGGNFQAFTAQSVFDGKISAIDGSGSGSVIDSDNFVELIVFDIIATDRAGNELSMPNPAYGSVLAWLRTHCWVNRQDGAGLLDDDDISTSPGSSDESCDESSDDSSCAGGNGLAEIQKLLETGDFDVCDTQEAAKIIAECLEKSINMTDSSGSQQLTAALMVNKCIAEKLPEVLKTHERTLRELSIPDVEIRVKELHHIGKKLQQFCRACLRLYPHIKDTVLKMRGALFAFEELKYYSQLEGCSHDMLTEQCVLTVRCLEDAQVSRQMFVDLEKVDELSQSIGKHCEKEMRALQRFHDEAKELEKQKFIAEKRTQLQRRQAERDVASRAAASASRTVAAKEREHASAIDRAETLKTIGKVTLGLAAIGTVVIAGACLFMGPAAVLAAGAAIVAKVSTGFVWVGAVAGLVAGCQSGDGVVAGAGAGAGAVAGYVLPRLAVAAAKAAAPVAVPAAVLYGVYDHSCAIDEAEKAEQALPALRKECEQKARTLDAAQAQVNAAQASADSAGAIFEQATRTATVLRSISALADSYCTIKKDMEQASCFTDMLRSFLVFFMGETSEKYGALKRRLDRPAPDDRSRSLGIVAMVARLLPDETIDIWHERLRDLDRRNEELLTLSCHAWDSFSSKP